MYRCARSSAAARAWRSDKARDGQRLGVGVFAAQPHARGKTDCETSRREKDEVATPEDAPTVVGLRDGDRFVNSLMPM